MSFLRVMIKSGRLPLNCGSGLRVVARFGRLGALVKLGLERKGFQGGRVRTPDDTPSRRLDKPAVVTVFVISGGRDVQVAVASGKSGLDDSAVEILSSLAVLELVLVPEETRGFLFRSPALTGLFCMVSCCCDCDCGRDCCCRCR